MIYVSLLVAYMVLCLILAYAMVQIDSWQENSATLFEVWLTMVFLLIPMLVWVAITGIWFGLSELISKITR